VVVMVVVVGHQTHSNRARPLPLSSQEQISHLGYVEWNALLENQAPNGWSYFHTPKSNKSFSNLKNLDYIHDS
jgi:hypothetical protein